RGRGDLMAPGALKRVVDHTTRRPGGGHHGRPKSRPRSTGKGKEGWRRRSGPPSTSPGGGPESTHRHTGTSSFWPVADKIGPWTTPTATWAWNGPQPCRTSAHSGLPNHPRNSGEPSSSVAGWVQARITGCRSPI